MFVVLFFVFPFQIKIKLPHLTQVLVCFILNEITYRRLFLVFTLFGFVYPELITYCKFPAVPERNPVAINQSK